ncbi:hypothetical protein QWY28_04990 [Nocardioides sp. SOB77]|uniref:DUF3040 domain-containing protein n=1 Tax=Nocardioides oceani TaxID=3058369 RepID=A0ABT8FDN1_9ACTN|nr:hypothetical protein [Nocardioides oceani]MDN4172287.1 hypothetical protein [Nocardioides oceani]
MSRPVTGREPLPDPREDEVRRRLADARHVEPVPVDVAARLDRVLAQLAEGDDVPSSGDELARRRRRRAAGLLAAAAVVTVAGLGLAQVLPGSVDDNGASAGSSAPRDVAASGPVAELEERRDGLVEDSAGRTAAEVPESTDSLSAYDASPSPRRLRPDHFAADALRARELVDGVGDRRQPAPAPLSSDPDSSTDKAPDSFFECTPADWGSGVAVPVLYDGEPHVLVFRAPAGDSQVADLLQCGTGEILRSTTLPAG